MLLILITLKNISHTGPYALFLPFLSCGLILYPTSAKPGFFPQIAPSGGHQARASATYSVRDCHRCSPHPQPHVLGSSRGKVAPSAAARKQVLGACSQFHLAVQRHSGLGRGGQYPPLGETAQLPLMSLAAERRQENERATSTGELEEGNSPEGRVRSLGAASLEPGCPRWDALPQAQEAPIKNVNPGTRASDSGPGRSGSSSSVLRKAGGAACKKLRE